MNTRRIATLAASAALIAATAFATTGCSLISHQATEIHYNASDGVGINVGSLDVRNAFIVSENGKYGNLVAGVVITSDKAQTLTVEYGTGSSKKTAELAVPAASTVSLGATGADGAEPLLLEGINSQPGSTLSVAFSSRDAGAQLIEVPVLTGQMDYYSNLVPSSPTPTPTPSLTPAP